MSEMAPTGSKYTDQNERMKAFEDLMLALYQVRDSNDKHILLPGLSELVNIYQQAENK